MALNEEVLETEGDEGNAGVHPKREHSLYKQIAAMSGTINAMTDSRRRDELAQLHLCNR